MNMKQLALTALAILTLSLGVYSQTTPKGDGTTVVPPIRLGPVIGVNGAMSMVDYKVEGQDRSVIPGSIFGVEADIPFTETIGLVGRLGYYTLAFNDKNKALDIPSANGVDKDETFPGISSPSLTTEGSFNYITLAALFRAGLFEVGFNFGLPVSAKVTNSSSNIPIPYTNNGYTLKSDISPTSDEQNMLVDVTFGATIPVVTSHAGQLRVEVLGAWPMNPMLNSTGKNLPHLDSNMRLPSLMLQVAYLFSL
jgi:hypothetical protein